MVEWSFIAAGIYHERHTQLKLVTSCIMENVQCNVVELDTMAVFQVERSWICNEAT